MTSQTLRVLCGIRAFISRRKCPGYSLLFARTGATQAKIKINRQPHQAGTIVQRTMERKRAEQAMKRTDITHSGNQERLQWPDCLSGSLWIDTHEHENQMCRLSPEFTFQLWRTQQEILYSDRFTTKHQSLERWGEGWCSTQRQDKTVRKSTAEITCFCLQHIKTGFGPYN